MKNVSHVLNYKSDIKFFELEVVSIVTIDGQPLEGKIISKEGNHLHIVPYIRSSPEHYYPPNQAGNSTITYHIQPIIPLAIQKIRLPVGIQILDRYSSDTNDYKLVLVVENEEELVQYKYQPRPTFPTRPTPPPTLPTRPPQVYNPQPPIIAKLQTLLVQQGMKKYNPTPYHITYPYQDSIFNPKSADNLNKFNEMDIEGVIMGITSIQTMKGPHYTITVNIWKRGQENEIFTEGQQDVKHIRYPVIKPTRSDNIVTIVTPTSIQILDNEINNPTQFYFDHIEEYDDLL